MMKRVPIHIREGHFALARTSWSLYINSKGRYKDTEEAERDVKEGDRLRSKAMKERNAELWNACVDSTSQALRVASHRVDIRTWRAECSLAAGDVESSVGDLT
jgi:DnaJ family protein C protein 3